MGPVAHGGRVAPGARPRIRTLLGLTIALALLTLLPSLGAVGAPTPPRPSLTHDSVSAFSVTTTWNGRSIANANAPSAAFAYGYVAPAAATFHWEGPAGTGNVGSIASARIQIVYLGLPLYTRSEISTSPLPSTNGWLNMSYDLRGDRYLVQGLLLLDAALLNTNGTTVWSETFYVRLTAPYNLVAATAGLLALGAVELYFVATVGPRSLEQARAQPPPEEAKPPEIPPTGGS